MMNLKKATAILEANKLLSSRQTEYVEAVDVIMEEITKYKELEEQGLLLKLPCKVGDTVWEVQKIRERIQQYEIISVNQGRMGYLYFNWELKDGYGYYGNLKGFGTSDIGKTVFLTKEEAEKELKKLESAE